MKHCSLERTLTAVKSHSTTLVAVRRIDRPFRLVPSAFEIVRDLSEGEGQEGRKGESGDLADHCSRDRQVSELGDG